MHLFDPSLKDPSSFKLAFSVRYKGADPLNYMDINRINPEEIREDKI
jgi:hypothetical protein